MVLWWLEPWKRVNVTVAIEAGSIKLLVTSFVLNMLGRNRKC